MVTDQKILHFLESKNADEQNLPNAALMWIAFLLAHGLVPLTLHFASFLNRSSSEFLLK